MVKRSGTGGRIALFALIGGIIAIPRPVVGPIFGVVVGGMIGYFVPGKHATPARVTPTSRTMQPGIIIAGIGAILLVYALSMDTSVSSGSGRINNIGLMRDQQNLLFVAGIAILVGVLMMVVGRNKSPAIVDPFDDPSTVRIQEQKRYAIRLGIERTDGRYVWGENRFTDLEDAIDFVKREQQGARNLDIPPP